jgi:hypothetical protein
MTPDRSPSPDQLAEVVKLGRHHAAAARVLFEHMTNPDPSDPPDLMQAGVATYDAWDRFRGAWKAAGGDCPFGWPRTVLAELRRLCDTDWHPSRFNAGPERKFDPVKARAALDAIDGRLARLAKAIAGERPPDLEGNQEAILARLGYRPRYGKKLAELEAKGLIRTERSGKGRQPVLRLWIIDPGCVRVRKKAR